MSINRPSTPGQPGRYGFPGQPGQYAQPGQYRQPEQYAPPGQFEQPGRRSCQPYTVQQGDTFNTLAGRYEISAHQIASANPDALLQQGQSICIPHSRRR